MAARHLWLCALVLVAPAWSCGEDGGSSAPSSLIDASSGGSGGATDASTDGDGWAETGGTGGGAAGGGGSNAGAGGSNAGGGGSDAGGAAGQSGDGCTSPVIDPFVWADSLVEPDKVRPVGKSLWVGKAAWSNSSDVKAELVKRVAAGEAPYVFFYHWGDGPGTPMSQVQNATTTEIDQWKAFGKAIAEGIGAGTAFVVLEPEWDVNPTGANSAKFKDALKSIIQTFRAISPEARLINGPGLWKSDSVYTSFADVASLMDLQGFLLHVVSKDPFCTKRSDGSYFGGGEDLTGALGIVDKVRERAARVQKLFGTKNFVLTDLGVTRCGWGDDGQKQIFAKLVGELPALYDEGLRGVSIRTGGPSDLAARYLGVENEGRFDWAGKPAEAEIKAVPGIMQSHMASLICP